MKKLVNRVFVGSSLKARCFRSGAWLTIGNASEKALALLSRIVLARLLMPSELGVIVLIATIIGFLECITEVGVKQFIIHHVEGEKYSYLNTVWWFQVVRASGIYAIAFIVSPYLCDFYFSGKGTILANHSMEELCIMVKVAFLSVFFNGFVSPGAFVLEKRLQFKKVILIYQTSAFLGLFLTIVLAFIVRNAWAMVLGFIATASLRSCASFIVCPFKPRFIYNREGLKALSLFAKGMFGIPLMSFLALNFEVFVGGKFFSAATLGLYGTSIVIATIPREIFQRLLTPLITPVFAERQHNTAFLRTSMLRIVSMISCFYIPTAVLLVSMSLDVLPLAFGKDFIIVRSAFSIKCFVVLLFVLCVPATCLFLAKGWVKSQRIFVIIRLIITSIVFYPLMNKYGFEGTVTAVLIGSLVAYVFQIYELKRRIGYSVIAHIQKMGIGTLIALSYLGIVRYIRPDWVQTGLLAIAWKCCIFVIVLGVAYLFKKVFFRNTIAASTPGCLYSVKAGCVIGQNGVGNLQTNKC